jgi:hypothetical protein
MSDPSRDIRILRELAKRYAEVAAKPIQDERRRLWSRHNALKPTRPLVLATYGMWNVWCREVFGDHALQCADPFYREHERLLRLLLFQDTVGDDFILEPWITQGAAGRGNWNEMWGLKEGWIEPDVAGGARKLDPPLKTWAAVAQLRMPHHVIDEQETRRNVQRLRDALGDIVEINADRSPLAIGFMADISTSLARLRGLEEIMVDMYDAPEELRSLLAFMRDGILTAQDEAERAGDFSLTSQVNQAMTYCDGFEPPRANSGPRPRKNLWAFAAAQEFTLISPEMHDRFLLQYQLPILKHWGLSAYGCCEDLTQKIDMLRQIPNLRIIAVTPLADIAKCAERIGADYVISWRPNPTDMVCADFNPERIRRIIRHGLEVSKGCRIHIHLKDVETVQGETDRLARWVRIVRDIADDYG